MGPGCPGIPGGPAVPLGPWAPFGPSSPLFPGCSEKEKHPPNTQDGRHGPFFSHGDYFSLSLGFPN